MKLIEFYCFDVIYFISTFSVSDLELKRLREAFKRHSSNGVITDKVFIKEVLGDGVPNPVAEVKHFMFFHCLLELLFVQKFGSRKFMLLHP